MLITKALLLHLQKRTGVNNIHDIFKALVEYGIRQSTLHQFKYCTRWAQQSTYIVFEFYARWSRQLLQRCDVT